MANRIQVNRKQLLIELAASEPLLVKEAKAVIKQQFFDPAVDALKKDFEENLVTQEIDTAQRNDGEGPNTSGTLASVPYDPKKADRNAEPNLWGFIGFERGSDPLGPIRERLDPSAPDKEGPQLEYKGKAKDKLSFTFEVSAPDFAAIQRETPMPWGDGGISWAKRIESGIPGLGFFLNAKNRAGSRSGGGIQVDQQLRGGGYRPVSYLSKLFNDFLHRVSTGREPG